ncbi:DUF2982 domain-containing protein [Thalassotalea maritima]|uniref:DUF2982 domain-containing protein n=1 Tax=Thalassotalea maritima TaxID=3242416 RepID=UPI0035292089
MKPRIEIYPLSRRHHRFLMVIGTVLLLVAIMIGWVINEQYRFPIMGLKLAAIVIIVVGFVKKFQPKASYILTPDIFQCNHPWGHIKLSWNDILDINQVKIAQDNIQLPYVGLKLTDIDCLGEGITPRLANKLLHEQKDLAAIAVKYKQLSLDKAVINFEPFKGKHLYRGPIAAFLHRSQHLQQAYGYHVYLPADSFDRDLMAFISLLKRCTAYRHDY